MSEKMRTKVSIKGMHCRSCELLVEEHLKEIENISKVKVNHYKGEAIIYYKGNHPSDEAIKAAILKAGYETGEEDKKAFLNLSSDNIYQLLLGASIIFSLYLILKGIGIDNINVGKNVSEPSFGLVVLIGLVAGISTCMALVGGLVLGLSTKFADKHPSASGMQKFRPHIFFSLGRILGYAVLGGLLGLLGSVFQMSIGTTATLTIIAALLMLFIGLQLIEIFPFISNVSLSLPPSVAKFFGLNKKKAEYSHKHAMILGALTFFLPCGFTQAMQVYAVSRGSFLDGAIIMGLFALGTAPGLLSIGGITAAVKGKGKDLFFKTAGIAIIVLSIFNINNAFKLFSVNNTSQTTNVVETKSDKKDPNVTIEDGYQIVRMRETSRGYIPNKFTIKKGMPVKWIIEAEAPYSCAAALVVPQLKMREFLNQGENILEFTPEETGSIKFSCSMGMYTGYFKVID